MSEVVLCDVQSAVARVTLNRPDKLNALDRAMIDALLGLLDQIEVDERIRAIILTGAGERAFSAGEPISALDAFAAGLVNEVVAHDALLTRAMALAQKVAAKSPLAVAACLGSVTRGLNVAIDEGLAIEAGYFERMLQTQDLTEGVSAWLERRPAEFVGR